MNDEGKGRGNDSATTMFVKYKQPASGQVLSKEAHTKQLTQTLADTG